MGWVVLSGLVVLAGGCLARGSIGAPPPGLAADRVAASRQMILVVTPGWEAVDGQLSRYERSAGGDGRWRRKGGSIPVVVGKSGLAWAGEFAPVLGRPGDPVKLEGDGRSPAGVFTLGPAFGYDPLAAMGVLSIDYRQATETLECVDDCRSSHYNQLVDRAGQVGRDWAGSEMMRRQDDYYRLGVVVNHNFPNPVACRGSCIFMHLWEGPGRGTVGCTAMPSEAMEEIVRWLDRAKSPILAQFTAADREKFLWIPAN